MRCMTRVCFPFLGLLVAANAFGVTLATDGQSEYAIVVGADAIASEQTAASELQSFLAEVTGGTLPILQEGSAEAAGAKRIIVGPCGAFREAFPDFDLDTLKHDGIFMKSVEDTLYLAGDRPRGTLYAVYTFLEEVVGCRWWSSSVSFTPHRATLEIPELNTVYVPKLLCREAFYRDAFDGVYAARSKCNGHFEKIPPEYGGHYTILGWCHTFYRILPPDKYFAAHPEWYSEIDGKRTADRTQLCLTNEAMRAEFIKNTLEWIRKDPTSGIISISQNDWHGACQCAKCAALQEDEGSASGPVIHFVNAVAEAIEQEFPEMLVETLAYSYTRHAPKHVKPRKNVVIRLCSIECSFAQPLGTGPQNVSFRQDIEDWSAIAHQLYIWDYVTDFANYIIPHPNLRVLAPNIRFFVENKAIGLFEQGDSCCTCSDFPELRAWLFAHLMWDPSRDEKALIAEFLKGYYGAAAEPLQQYIDLIHDAVERSGVHLRCYMKDTSDWFSLDDVNRATALFDEAEERVADDAALLERVQRARMPLDHVWINRYRVLRYQAKKENKPFLGPEDPVAAVDEFIARARAFDAGCYREGRPFEQYETALRQRFRPACPPPDLCKDMDPDDFLDVQDNLFRLANPGEWAAIVDDAAASDEKAARMPADHTQWAVQYAMGDDVQMLDSARCYAVVRCDAKAASGTAMSLGIYDANARANVLLRPVSIEEAGKGYVTIDLGVLEVKPGMYFWSAPANNPDQVDAVYVDRVFFVREALARQ